MLKQFVLNDLFYATLYNVINQKDKLGMRIGDSEWLNF